VTQLSTSLTNVPVNATLTTRMHDALEAAIINGELKPGERIHADALAAQYGMSRIPVREALRSLHEAGWVDIKPRHGVHVRERTGRELDELFEFRAVVEGQVARWAAERRSDADLDALSGVVAAGDSSEARPVVNSSSAFYAVLRTAAGNSVLATTSAALEKRARFYFSTVADQMGEDWKHVHEDLLELVRRQEADKAQALASHHIVDTGKAVRRLLFEQ
jgi:DNA-binding GntR family transcriptional regulator